MPKRRVRRLVAQVSVVASLALSGTLLLLSGGTQTSMAQVTLSPSCSLIDPITGLCETVTSLLSPSPTATTTTTTTTPLPTSISTSPAPVTTSPVSGGTGGTTAPGSGTTGGTGGGLNPPAGVLGGPGLGAGPYGGGLFFAPSGSYGGGTTYFAPNGQPTSSSQVYYQSAFGKSISPTVPADAVAEGMRSVPVASALTTVPARTWILVPAGLLLLVAVTYLVLEVNDEEVAEHIPQVVRSTD